MSPAQLQDSRPFFSTTLVVASIVSLSGVLWASLISWWGLIYVSAGAFFFWQAFTPLPGRKYPKTENVQSPISPLETDENL
jgi:hypothetical protein